MKLNEIQTKGQFHQKLLSPVLSKVIKGLDEYKETLYGIGWLVDYTVAPDGKSVSVKCENHDHNAATEWVKRWRIYDHSFLPDLGENDIEIEMVHDDDDTILFNVNILDNELAEGKLEDFMVASERDAIDHIKGRIERVSQKKSDDWKEGAMWVWKVFADRYGKW